MGCIHSTAGKMDCEIAVEEANKNQVRAISKTDGTHLVLCVVIAVS